MDWLLHQLSDSAFPTGGFVHSGGLEAAFQQGLLRTPSELEAFVRDWVWQTGWGALPLVRAAHREPSQLAAFDARAHSFLVGQVPRRASSTQGRAFLDTCARIFAAVEPVQQQAREQQLHCHFAPMFGAVLAALEVPEADAQRLFLSLGVRGVLSAGVRLGVAGTHEAQRLQHALGGLLTEVLQRCGELDLDALAQTSPLLDLCSGTHDRLYSRLFQS